MLKQSGEAYAKFTRENEDICLPIAELLDTADRVFHKLEDAAEHQPLTDTGRVRHHYIEQMQTVIGALLDSALVQTFNHAGMTMQIERAASRKVVRAVNGRRLPAVLPIDD